MRIKNRILRLNIMTRKQYRNISLILVLLRKESLVKTNFYTS